MPEFVDQRLADRLQRQTLLLFFPWGLAARAPDAVTVWELSDTPHIGGLAHHPEAWEDRVVGFL